MERKKFTPVIRGVDGAGKVSIIVATLNQIDHDDDVALPGFFGQQVTTVVPSHGHTHVPLGNAIVRETATEVIADIKFNLRVNAAIDWYEAIRYDFENPPALQEYSYAWSFSPGGYRYGELNGKRVRFLQPLSDGRPGMDLMEISPVLRGAGVGVRTLAVKRYSQPPRSENELRAELQRIKDAFQRRQLQDIRDQNRDEMRREELRGTLYDARQTFLKITGIPYSRDAEWLVPVEVRAAAEASVRLYAPQLGLDRESMKIVWFSAEDDTGASNPGEFADFYAEKPLLGKCHPQTEPNVIYLNSSLSSDEAHSVAAHELKHLAGGSEAEAMLYESKALLERMGY
ncbi:hypothetical protein [Streptomyces sp. NPDC057686]|uniref:hypothetical protein n=1 Tax=Streptomyces sp. NPDC057686 TaxID=3346212 RepID=UPI003697DEBF